MSTAIRPTPPRPPQPEPHPAWSVATDIAFTVGCVAAALAIVCAAACDPGDEVGEALAREEAAVAAADGAANDDDGHADHLALALAPPDSCARLLFVDLRTVDGSPDHRAVVVRAAGCQEDQEGLSVSVGPGEVPPLAAPSHRWPIDQPVVAGPSGCRVVGGADSQGWGPQWHPLETPVGDWATYHAVLWNAAGVAIDSVSIPGDLSPAEQWEKPGAPVSGVRLDDDGLWRISHDYGGFCDTWKEWLP